MKKIKFIEVLKTIIILSIIVLVAGAYLYSIENPEISFKEMFLKFWKFFFIEFVFLMFAFILELNKDE